MHSCVVVSLMSCAQTVPATIAPAELERSWLNDCKLHAGDTATAKPVGREQIEQLKVGMTLDAADKALGKPGFLRTDAGPYYRAQEGGWYGLYANRERKIGEIVYWNRDRQGIYVLPVRLRGRPYPIK
jgi:hypothetical protein